MSVSSGSGRPAAPAPARASPLAALEAAPPGPLLPRAGGRPRAPAGGTAMAARPPAPSHGQAVAA
eukprot:8675753-Lingulodinium_polyedra.AAC.1